ncbi:hypothetical protein GGQ73_003111 [Rhizobium skierniewicense]|uniref:Uncharacterized protein n=1 Tax=Rhizobium skierniewicense TaxID=984260 RepID=A0A7W6CEK9_9HYPH|nr:hypothetical protein [Rhizobium skierniewicense]MBB3947145.1 hypothetical protein [Rhizobium skierniewicense]
MLEALFPPRTTPATGSTGGQSSGTTTSSGSASSGPASQTTTQPAASTPTTAEDKDTDDGTYSPAPTQPATSESQPVDGQPTTDETASAQSPSASAGDADDQPVASAPIEDTGPEPTNAPEKSQPTDSEPVADEPTASNDNDAEAGKSMPVENGTAGSSAPIQGTNGSVPQTASPSTPVASAPVAVRRPVSSDGPVRTERPFQFDAVETRSSLRRLADEEQAAADAARNHAAEVQKNRILRGLLDAIANTDPAVTKSTLLADTDTQEPKPSLVETYYAQA